MIDYIYGTIVELTPTMAVVEANGIGYDINISLNSFSKIQEILNNSATDTKIKVYTYLKIAEDEWNIYGFYTKQERELFTHLIGVSGVGGSTARMILSAYSTKELCEIIASGNYSMLKNVKGIGLKTAQRIIVDLKDKLTNSELIFDKNSNTTGTIATNNNENANEAIAALTMLGFSPAPSKKVVMSIVSKDNSLTPEEIIKQALKMM